MYEAIVCKIKTREHPNADKLQLGLVAGFQVVVGLETENDELGVFFPTDGILSDEFCKANDLYSRFDESNNRLNSGFFTEGEARVRSQNFRGEKSYGYWCPLSSFDFIKNFDTSVLVDGYTFSSLGGVEICKKHYSKATLKAISGNNKNVKRANSMFLEHVDTKQFRYRYKEVKPGSLVTITSKMHGTSGRIARVLDEVPAKRNLVDKILRRTRTETKWNTLLGSRRVVLKDYDEDSLGFYGSNEFRYQTVKSFKDYLNKGETIYYEIVGWATEDTPIMAHDTSSLKVIRKEYGDRMVYSYGCAQGMAAIYVYRITQTNEDGVSIELSWNQIKARCNELGINYTPEMCDPFVAKDSDSLKELVVSWTAGRDVTDPSHIREGVVVRVDSDTGTMFLKNKSFDFGVLEGYIKDDENYVDLEEIS